MTDKKPSGFDVVIHTIGKNENKFRNDVQVSVGIPPKDTVMLATDEGAFHGGDGSAPSPLEYFTTSLTACLMTQIRAFSKRLNIAVDSIVVETRFEWRAIHTDRAPYEANAIRFVVEADLGDDIPLGDRVRLFQAAQLGCFVEQALKPGLVSHKLKDVDGWVDAD